MNDPKQLAELKPLAPGPVSSRIQFRNSLRELFYSPKEIFFLYCLNYISSLQYYLLITLIPLYFTDRLGTSDLVAGLIFGGWGVLIGLVSISLGSSLSRLRMTGGLHISYSASLLGFLLMALSDNLALNLLAVLSLHSVSGATAWPVIEWASKAYTSESARALSNSCIMISNYAAGTTAGFLIDFTYHNTDACFQFYFGLGAGLGILGHCLTLAMNNPEVSVTDDSSLREVVSTPKFWKFAGFVSLLILLRAGCFGQLDATMAKYMTRTLGSDAHFGLILALHSVTMVFGVFSLTALTYSYSSYSLIAAGGAIGSVAAAFMVADYAYWNTVLFVVLLSIGESIWVARLLDYTLNIAPSSQEGVYLALCNSPFYFGMIVTGLMSGLLLEQFCTEEGDSDCWLLWLIIALVSGFIVGLLVVLRRVLEDTTFNSAPSG